MLQMQAGTGILKSLKNGFSHRKIELLLRIYLGRADSEFIHWDFHGPSAIHVVHGRELKEISVKDLLEYFMNYHH